MKIQTAFSVRTTVPDAVADLRAQLGAFEARMVIFFASPAFPPREIAAEMAGAGETAARNVGERSSPCNAPRFHVDSPPAGA